MFHEIIGVDQEPAVFGDYYVGGGRVIYTAYCGGEYYEKLAESH